jgi:hypothetical protein
MYEHGVMRFSHQGGRHMEKNGKEVAYQWDLSSAWQKSLGLFGYCSEGHSGSGEHYRKQTSGSSHVGTAV